MLDPIWQVMPRRMADGPWTTTGDLACPLLTTERELAEGDVLWVDTGISYGGFHSDFGRTWVVGRRARRPAAGPVRALAGDHRRRPRRHPGRGDRGRSDRGGDEAAGGEKPWMPHFYLGHGLGIDSAESPYVGTDLGEAYDASLVLAAGMVLVIEPVVWDDGAAGYRSEEVLAHHRDGWEPITDYPYDPF